MKKNQTSGYLILGILLILLTVISFVIPTEKTESFWISYTFTIVALILQIPVWNKSMGERESLKSKVLGIPAVYVGIVYLVLQIIILAVFIAMPTLSSWMAIVACASLLGLSTVCMLSSQIGRNTIQKTEEKVRSKIGFMKNLQADIELLVEAETNAEVKTELKQLAETIRFSDPMSHEQLEDLEIIIQNKITELRITSDKKQLISEILLLLADRNKKCKILK